MNEKIEHALIIGTFNLAEMFSRLSEVFNFNAPEIREGLKSELDRTPFSRPNQTKPDRPDSTP